MLALLAGAVQLNLLTAKAVVSMAEDFELTDAEEQTNRKEGAPRLIVLITVSGLETGLLELTLEESGQIELLKSALLYPQVRHPLISADAAVSAAILHTGVLGLENGVTARRPLHKLKNGTLDRSLSVFSSGKYSGIGTSERLAPETLLSSTISDAVKRASGGLGLVYSVATRPEEAIIGGGADADGVFWTDETRGERASSNYYPAKLPWYISKLSAPRVKLSKGISWTPCHHSDFFEKYGKWTFRHEEIPFSHTLTRTESYLNTPLANEEVTETALSLIENGGLGTDGNTDVLVLTYRLAVPEELSPAIPSPEIIDGYYRLEEEIRRLRKQLPKETVLIISGDGMAPAEARADAENRTFHPDKCKALTNMYLDTRYGVKGLVKEITEEGQLYLDEERLKASKLDSEEVSRLVSDFLQEFAGVAYAFPEWELRRNLLTNDGNAKLLTAIHSVPAKDRGNVVFGLQANFAFGNGSEGSSTHPATHFASITSPLLILGPGITPGRIETPLDLRNVSKVICETLRIRPPSR